MRLSPYSIKVSVKAFGKAVRAVISHTLKVKGTKAPETETQQVTQHVLHYNRRL